MSPQMSVLSTSNLVFLETRVLNSSFGVLFGFRIAAKVLISIMKHLRATSIVHLLPEKQETINLSCQAYDSRTLMRYGIILVCILLLASYVVGIILNLLCKFPSLEIAIQESRGLRMFNTTKIVEDDSSPPIKPCILNFMDGKTVILVSHELSLSGGPLLLMELGSILQRSGANVFWITANKKKTTFDSVVLLLEKKLLNQGIHIMAARGVKTITATRMADLVVFNTAVAGKWIDTIPAAEVQNVLTKTLWWIHEMRGHYFAMEYVKHLTKVAGIMIDSHATAEYWRKRTKYHLRFTLPKIYVVHLGNSQQLMQVAEDTITRLSIRQHVRHVLGIYDDDVVFAMINSVSRGKGQDMFLRAFVEGMNLVKQINTVQEKTVFSVHALLVGSDWANPSYELMLRSFVKDNSLESKVHFMNKSFDIVSFLAASDVLVQNSQGRGECFGRITIEAMAFQLPVLGTAVGGTLEIVVNGSTGRLHPIGKEGVHILAQNIKDLTLNKSLRIEMGGKGYDKVKQHFMECHLCERLGLVLQIVLSKLLFQHYNI